MLQWLHELYAKITPVLQEFGPVKASVASMIAAIGTLLASRKWLLEKYDGKILHMLQESRRMAQVNQRPGQHVVFFPFAFQDIMKEAKRNEKSVRRSLRRLEDHGYVHEVRDGWNLGPRPEALTLAKLYTFGQTTDASSRWGDRWSSHW
jgi:hypothetical protein